MRTKTQQERDLRKKAIQSLITSRLSHREIGILLSISPSVVSYYRTEISNDFVARTLKYRTSR